MFAGKWYQKEICNLSHSHIIVELYFEQMTGDERCFFDDFLRAIIFYIVKTVEIDKFKEDGVFNSEHGIHTVYENAINF